MKNFIKTTVVFIVILICLLISFSTMYVCRINIIEKVNIAAFSNDTSDFKQIHITGVGPVGREFVFLPDKEGCHWNTKDFFLKNIRLELPSSFFKNDDNFISINQYKFPVKFIGKFFILGNTVKTDPVLIIFSGINKPSFLNKLTFFVPKLPAIIFGGAYYLTPILFLFLIFIFIFDYKKRSLQKKSPGV